MKDKKPKEKNKIRQTPKLTKINYKKGIMQLK